MRKKLRQIEHLEWLYRDLTEEEEAKVICKYKCLAFNMYNARRI